MRTTTGVVFRPQSPPERLREVVEAADAAEAVDELWLWEDCFLEGGLTAAAAALAWSSRVRVGIGLLPVPLRNPALVAMEVATLARLFPDRFVLGLGHGVLDWMAQVGARAPSPMTLLREHTSAVVALLAGERVTVSGSYVQLDDVALDWPPERLPRLLLGARGPRTVALAGELTDGVLLDAVAGPDEVARARETAQEARRLAGREGEVHVAAYTQVGAAEVSADAVAERVALLAAAGADTVVLQSDADDPDPLRLVSALEG
ncbi:LLM class flavin-dependent oxidoreductase [Nocardioides aurantiacus]|uniref:Alkanesulfonate monooxygenase SsuD/methylene tetrahydromethanopterin reductase-like flavin-dependent oxidoreductase (Luciferase family) n=1 Tax=Nocardioides aurantiacus TaxID=86796 RepID=A0A3N2CXE2_9ACTN|nr:LLM class flavin-dependent oxidoreductase [Nocardioides aurantiacus]ROR91884.1 alkanesulfonate monooxygenase SsuD/methylene tetrahydromethanopterin reductase-like flavin-dependent oxidoreductase (luciferase family) [Nocardioides aurantiacus]